MRIMRLMGAIRHPIVEWQVTKAKRKYRRFYPLCAVCDIGPSFFGKANDVHHRIPVHVNPLMATGHSNFRTMCSLHHLTTGHLGNYKDYNENLDETIEQLRRTLDQYGVSYLELRQWNER